MNFEMRPRATAVEARSHIFILVLCGLMIVAGLAYSLYLGDTLPYVDEQDYYAIAQNLVSKQSFSSDGVVPTAWRPPGYPFFLATLIFLGADVPLLRAFNFIALALTIYFVYDIVKRMTNPLAGLAAGIFLAGYPVMFYLAGTLFPQTFGMLLFVLALAAIARSECLRPLVLIVAGGLFGALILTIPTFIFQLFVVAGWLVLFRRVSIVRVGVALLLPALIVTGMWSVRNYLVFGSFVFVTTNAGLPLLIGNYHGASPNADPAQYLKDLAPEMERAEPLSEVEGDRYFRAKAIEFMTSEPAEAARLYLLKVLNYFNYSNEIHAAGQQSSLKDLVMLASYGTLLLLALIRLLLVRHMPFMRFEWLLWLLYFSNAFFAAIFFTKIRYRLPFDALLIAIAAIALYMLGRKILGRTVSAQVNFS